MLASPRVALFTQLDTAAAAELAAHFGLGAVHAMAGIEAGTVNSNYRLDTEGGRVFVRINEGKAPTDVRFEAELVAHLGARGVRTPAPLCARDGAPWATLPVGLVTVFPWVAAQPACARALTDAQAHAAGGLLAAIHDGQRGFTGQRADRYALPALAARLAALPALSGDAARARDVIAARFAIASAGDVARAALPAGVIHQDLFVDNVLEGDGAPWAIDFEQAVRGPFVYDLAVALCAWSYDDTFAWSRAAALVAGYQVRRALMPDERAALHGEALRAAARFCLTRLTDVELDPRVSAAQKQRKSFRRYLARHDALAALDAAGFAARVGLSG